ncbi:MAG: sulfatase-like hydrolase/transferase [Planctomycetaceae bacterium]|nr:sulfatase-like hydrolase/transferase [Planctomycetaceae bacterium]
MQIRSQIVFMMLLTCLTGLITTSASAAKQPNIILIMADDMGYECVQANGGTSYKTPRLNELAKTGMRFTHCYSQPICTPSRVELMTGLYNQRNYIRFGVLDPQQTTFAQLLKRAGYKTCIAGKWQLEGGFNGPTHFGFDEHCLWQLARIPTLTKVTSRYPNPGLEINGQEVDFNNGEYGPDIACNYLCDFIKRNHEGPFLAYYPMILPHWPFEPTPDSEEWDPAAKGAGSSQKHTKYFVDMVNYTDKMVGRLVDQLEESGIRENTLLIFTCDNGTATTVTSKMGDLTIKGGKGLPTDAGMHVSLIANWPGKIESGTTCSDLVDFTDFLPTLVDVADAEVPNKLHLDGQSFLPQLLGQQTNARQWIYCWYARNGGKQGAEFVQNHNWKVYRNGRIFQIGEDKLEKNNLASRQQTLSEADKKQLKQLHTALDQYTDTRKMLPEPYPENKPRKPKKNKQNKKKATN